MNGFEWSDKRGLEATGLFRSLRDILAAPNLPSVMPQISESISSQISLEFRRLVQRNGSAKISVFELAKRIVLRANCTVFFPAELGENCFMDLGYLAKNSYFSK